MQYDFPRPIIASFTIWVTKDIHLIAKTLLDKASNGALASQ